jgi:hypothetical protein
MCACKETDVRESANDCTLASGEGHGSCEEMCYATFDENPISTLVVRTVLANLYPSSYRPLVMDAEAVSEGVEFKSIVMQLIEETEDCCI